MVAHSLAIAMRLSTSIGLILSKGEFITLLCPNVYCYRSFKILLYSTPYMSDARRADSYKEEDFNWRVSPKRNPEFSSTYGRLC